MNPLPSAEPTTQDLPDDPGPDEPDSSSPGPGDHAQPIHIEVVCHTEPIDADLVDWLQEQVTRAVTLCEVVQAQLTVAIVADDEMAQLHEQYTGVQGTTDVLTFDLLTDSAPAEGGSPPGSNEPTVIIEGDIVVCIDEAQRQAGQRDHDARHELLLYAIHGLMHLLGEDDHAQEDYQRMHAREDALLKQMGFGPLFDPDRDTDSNSPL